MPVSSRPVPRRSAVERERTRAPHALTPAAQSPAPGLAATTSVQRGGGPQDSALYQCGCGCRFHAPVSTSVRCPACDGAQTW